MIERIDAETLAAFLDGKLDPAERSRVLASLAKDPEERRILADVVALQREAVTTPDAALPLPRRRRWIWVVTAAAAAVVALAVFTRRTASPLELVLETTQRLSNARTGTAADRFGAEWMEPGWSVTRGDTESAERETRSFRLGARAVDLQTARAIEDSIAFHAVAAAIRDLVSIDPAGAPVAALLDSPLRTPESVDRVVRAMRTAAPDSLIFDLGAWTEAARLAIRQGDQQMLSSILERPLELIRRSLAGTSPSTNRANELLAALAAGSPQISRVGPIVDSLIRTLGR